MMLHGNMIVFICRRIRRNNTVAYASLMMACQSGPFGHVNNARSAEFPNGNAKKAWDTFKSGNMANAVALSHQWTKCTLRENENPTAGIRSWILSGNDWAIRDPLFRMVPMWHT